MAAGSLSLSMGRLWTGPVMDIHNMIYYRVSSSGADQADHADQAGEVHINRIMQKRCRSSGSCR
ncbi:hypothetical protein DY000_02052276 [Brassica cretica]|uniref:Uncharacterized protein n=1 Tax=Brassica cretica TaxID=69181 RepID=A0ABQ7AL03_BRACR|nr:hypothetical protein DY000_02052276 [Brassica cretica]